MKGYPYPPGVLMFRVEPESRAHYFHVYIWPTLGHTTKPGTMRHYVGQYGDATGVNRAHAFTLDLTVHHRGVVPRGLLGQMHFCQRYLTEDFIAHECLHAAITFGRWKRIDGLEIFDKTNPRNEAEERLCYALGSMCAQVTATAGKYGYL